MNAFQIKMIMAILMVFDHISYIPSFIPPIWTGIFHAITRCVGVWFGYMIVEGFIHTHNRVKYNLRLFCWAFIMFLGNSILNYLFSIKEIQIHNNIFLTLALSLLMLNVLFSGDKNNPKKFFMLRIILFIIIGLIALFIAEGSIPMIPFIIITYVFRDKNKLRNLSYIALSIILFASSFVLYDSWDMTIMMTLYNSDWLFITVIPFMYLYNGKRGLNNKFSKYFFYIFYPLHLWIITIISFLTK